ncbi:MAG: FliH/SctL family protein [Thermodesulfovibrionales bacterium]
MIQPYTPLQFDEYGNVREGASASSAAQKPDVLDEEVRSRIQAMEEEALARGAEKGHAAGYEKGLQDGEKETRKKLERLEGIIKELENFKNKRMHEVLPALIELSLDVAKKIVQKEVELDRDVILKVARDAVRKVGEGEEQIVVKVNPRDYEVIVGGSETLKEHAGVREVVVEALAAISPGGCLIETKTGEIDATVDGKIKEVEDVIGTATNS